MTILQAIVLGIVQGVTEFLPVSSSGHLILVPSLFGWDAQPVAFDAIMHLATLGAVIVALRAELMNILRDLWPRTARGGKKAAMGNWGKLGLIIIAATVPAVLAALIFRDAIESTLRSPAIVAVSLAFWGILLVAADRFAAGRKGKKDVAAVGWKRGMLIGVAQAISLIPGTSRSGVTITAGLFSGLDRAAAARFSFLLGIPAIAGAGTLALVDVLEGAVDVPAAPLAIGFLVAFFSGFLAIKGLLKLLERGSYAWFGAYRLALALIIVLILL